MFAEKSNRHKKPFKVIAYITLIAILFTSIPADLVQSAEPVSGPISADRAHNAKRFFLPPELGTVQDSWYPAQPKTSSSEIPTIIHIQDAHCNYSAQRKIALIIEYLSRVYRVNTVNLEGGAGEYDLSTLNAISDTSAREAVSDRFVKEGLLSGAEYFAANNPGSVDLWGMEDIGLYRENLGIYRDSLKHKNEVDGHLKSLSRILSDLKIHIYPKDLLEFDADYSQYKAGNMEFKEYISALTALAGKISVDTKPFVNLETLGQVLRNEPGIDFDKANSERDRLIERLRKALSNAETAELAVKTAGFGSGKSSPSDYYPYIAMKAHDLGIDPGDFPHFSKYLVYITQFATIDNAKIMDEIASLEKKLKDALCVNDTQRELEALSRNLAITKNIFNVMITREDYRYYKANEESFGMGRYTAFINKEAPRYKVGAKMDADMNTIDRYRNEILKFYECSLKRDEAFIRNIKLGSLAPGAGSLRPQATVVITGGFHTENLCGLFRKNGMSYVSIMPNFKGCDADECPYFRLLGGKLYGEYMKIALALGVSNLAIASILNQLGALARGREEYLASMLHMHMEIASATGCRGIRIIHGNGVRYFALDGEPVEPGAGDRFEDVSHLWDPGAHSSSATQSGSSRRSLLKSIGVFLASLSFMTPKAPAKIVADEAAMPIVDAVRGFLTWPVESGDPTVMRFSERANELLGRDGVTVRFVIADLGHYIEKYGDKLKQDDYNREMLTKGSARAMRMQPPAGGWPPSSPFGKNDTIIVYDINNYRDGIAAVTCGVAHEVLGHMFFSAEELRGLSPMEEEAVAFRVEIKYLEALISDKKFLEEFPGASYAVIEDLQRQISFERRVLEHIESKVGDLGRVDRLVRPLKGRGESSGLNWKAFTAGGIALAAGAGIASALILRRIKLQREASETVKEAYHFATGKGFDALGPAVKARIVDAYWRTGKVKEKTLKQAGLSGNQIHKFIQRTRMAEGPRAGAAPQMGKRARGAIKAGHKLAVTDSSGNTHTVDMISHGRLDIPSLKDRIAAMADVAEQSKKDMLELLSLLETSPPELYTFNTLTEDLFGIASPKDGAIAVYHAIQDDPIALFHETMEYLIRSGTVGISLQGNTIDLIMRQTGRTMHVSVSAATIGLLKGEEWWDAQAQDVRPGSADSRAHYCLRILQQEAFGVKNTELTELVKGLQIVAKLRAFDGHDVEYGLKSGTMRSENNTVYEELLRIFAENGFNDEIGERVANALARMKPGSVEMLQIMGVLNEKERSLLGSKDAAGLGDLSRDERRELVARLKRITASYQRSVPASIRRDMLRRLVPVGIIRSLMHEHGIARAALLQVIRAHPDFHVWLPKARIKVDEIKERVGGITVAWNVVKIHGLDGIDSWVARAEAKAAAIQDRVGGNKNAWSIIINQGLDNVDTWLTDAEAKVTAIKGRVDGAAIAWQIVIRCGLDELDDWLARAEPKVAAMKENIGSSTLAWRMILGQGLDKVDAWLSTAQVKVNSIQERVGGPTNAWQIVLGQKAEKIDGWIRSAESKAASIEDRVRGPSNAWRIIIAQGPRDTDAWILTAETKVAAIRTKVGGAANAWYAVIAQGMDGIDSWLTKAEAKASLIKSRVGGAKIAWAILTRRGIENIDAWVTNAEQKVASIKDTVGGTSNAWNMVIAHGLVGFDTWLTTAEQKAAAINGRVGGISNARHIVIRHGVEGTDEWLTKAEAKAVSIQARVGGMAMAWQIVINRNLDTIDTWLTDAELKVATIKDTVGDPAVAWQIVISQGLEDLDTWLAAAGRKVTEIQGKVDGQRNAWEILVRYGLDLDDQWLDNAIRAVGRAEALGRHVRTEAWRRILAYGLEEFITSMPSDDAETAGPGFSKGNLDFVTKGLEEAGIPITHFTQNLTQPHIEEGALALLLLIPCWGSLLYVLSRGAFSIVHILQKGRAPPEFVRERTLFEKGLFPAFYSFASSLPIVISWIAPSLISPELAKSLAIISGLAIHIVGNTIIDVYNLPYQKGELGNGKTPVSGRASPDDLPQITRPLADPTVIRNGEIKRIFVSALNAKVIDPKLGEAAIDTWPAVSSLHKRFPKATIYVATYFPGPYFAEHFDGKVVPIPPTSLAELKVAGVHEKQWDSYREAEWDGFTVADMWNAKRNIPQDKLIDFIDTRKIDLVVDIYNAVPSVWDLKTTDIARGKTPYLISVPSPSGTFWSTRPEFYRHKEDMVGRGATFTDRDGKKYSIAGMGEAIDEIAPDGRVNTAGVWRFAMSLYNTLGLDVNEDSLDMVKPTMKEGNAALELLKGWYDRGNTSSEPFDPLRKIFLINVYATTHYDIITEEAWGEIIARLLKETNAYLVFTHGGPMDKDAGRIERILQLAAPEGRNRIILPRMDLHPAITDILGVADWVLTIDTGMSHLASGIYNRPTTVITRMDVLHWLPPRGSNVRPVLVDNVEDSSVLWHIRNTDFKYDDFARLLGLKHRALIEDVVTQGIAADRGPMRPEVAMLKLSALSIINRARMDKELLAKRLTFPGAEEDIRSYLRTYIDAIGYEKGLIPSIAIVDSAAQMGIGIPRFKVKLFLGDSKPWLLIDRSALVQQDGGRWVVRNETKDFEVLHEVLGHMFVRSHFPEYAQLYKEAVASGVENERVLMAKTAEEALARLMTLSAYRRYKHANPGFRNEPLEGLLATIGVDLNTVDMPLRLPDTVKTIMAIDGDLNTYRYRKVLENEAAATWVINEVTERIARLNEDADRLQRADSVIGQPTKPQSPHMAKRTKATATPEEMISNFLNKARERFGDKDVAIIEGRLRQLLVDGKGEIDREKELVQLLSVLDRVAGVYAPARNVLVNTRYPEEPRIVCIPISEKICPSERIRNQAQEIWKELRDAIGVKGFRSIDCVFYDGTVKNLNERLAALAAGGTVLAKTNTLAYIDIRASDAETDEYARLIDMRSNGMITVVREEVPEEGAYLSVGGHIVLALGILDIVRNNRSDNQFVTYVAHLAAALSDGRPGTKAEDYQELLKKGDIAGILIRLPPAKKIDINSNMEEYFLMEETAMKSL